METGKNTVREVGLELAESGFLLGARLAGAGTLVLGSWGLAGWLVGRPEWTTFGHGWPVAPRVALALVVFGAALLVHLAFPRSGRAKFWVGIGTLVVLLVVVWSCFEITSSFRVEMESRLFRIGAGFNGDMVYRVPRVVLAGLALAAASLLALAWRGGRVANLCIAGSGWVVALLHALVLFGYFYNVRDLSEGGARPISILGALGMICAGVALVAAGGPRTPPLSALVGPRITARLLRAVVPAVLGTLLVAEALTYFVLDDLLGHAGLKGMAHAILPLLAAAGTIAFVVRRTGAMLEHSEAELRTAHDLLDQRVRERTQELAGTNEQLRAEVLLRTQAEAELRRQREQLVLALESAKLGTWEYDLETRLFISDERNAGLLGVTHHEGSEKIAEIARHIPPDDLAKLLQRLETTVAERSDFEQEFRVHRPEGAERWLIARGRALCDSGGKARRVIGVNFDITERRKAEQTLIYQEKLYRALFALSPVGILLEDTEGRILDANEALCQTIGYARAELIGQNTRIFVLPGEQADAEQHLAWLGAGQSLRHERWNVRKDGTPCLVLLRESPMMLPDGNQGVLVVAEDITERKRTEEALRDSEERFRTVFESAPLGIAIYGTDGRYLQVNRAGCEMLGRSVAELLATGPFEITHPDDIAEGRQLLGELVAGRCNGYAREKRFLRKDGGVVITHVSVTGVRSSHGAIQFIFSMALDITETRRMQQEMLEVSAHERRQFSYSLHDGLGQYLSGLSLKAKCLEEDLRAAGSAYADGAASLGRWISQASAQARAMGRGLDPVQVEVGGLVPALHKLAQESEELLSLPCGFRCNVPEVKLAPEVGLHLFRITQEGIHNASKHAQARRVELELTVDAEGLCLSIKDDGVGFPDGFTATDGMGLRSMRFRADSIGANLSFNGQTGLGVEVKCILPSHRFSAENHT